MSVEHRLVGSISASLTAGSVLRIVAFASRLPWNFTSNFSWEPAEVRLIQYSFLFKDQAQRGFLRCGSVFGWVNWWWRGGGGGEQ